MKTMLFALALIIFAGAAPAQTITAGDPASVAAALTAMGYKPSAIKPNDGNPLFTVAINDFDTAVVFGDCADGRKCRYFALVSRFTDIKNAPADWINARNGEMDLGKVWSGDEGILSFSMPIPTGGETMTAAALRYMLDEWQAIVGTLSRSAIEAKLVK